VFRTLSNAGRLLRMARALAAHDALVPREYAGRVPVPLRLAASLAGGRRSADPGLTPGQRLAKALEQMGPSAIKLGQLLATRPDILGAEVARGLESLQDRLPPFPDAEARRIVERELNRPLETVFSKFGPPVAAASIAQVHEAETAGDVPKRVAVKILRPISTPSGSPRAWPNGFPPKPAACGCANWSRRSPFRSPSNSISGWRAPPPPNSRRTPATIPNSACPRSIGRAPARMC
jgi:hypothetical protein